MSTMRKTSTQSSKRSTSNKSLRKSSNARASSTRPRQSSVPKNSGNGPKMYERTVPRRPIAAMHKGPGPVYQLQPVVGFEDHCNTKRRLPAYSMSGRGKQFQDDCSPGPKYAIEKGFTRTGPDGTPKVGVSGRHKDLTSFQTPSPAAYRVNADPTKLRAPEFTMASRTASEEPNRNPDKYQTDPSGKWVFHSPPSYSLSVRTKQSKTDNNPAPNAYTLPTTVGDKLVDKKTLPSYSIRSRPEIGSFAEDLQRTPGPGTYKVTEPSTYKNKQPTYSITGRNEVPGDTTQKPGPGAHKPENTPGPGAYKTTPPETTKKRSPAYHLIGKSSMPSNGGTGHTPGPANYNNEVYIVKKKAPEFSFGIRHSEYTAPLIVDVPDCD